MGLHSPPVKDKRWGFHTEGQERVFRVLADLAGDDPGYECQPSQKWLAHVTGFHRGSVNVIIQQLKDMGMVEKVRGGNRFEPGIYRVVIPEGYPVHGEEAVVGDEQGDLFGAR